MKLTKRLVGICKAASRDDERPQRILACVNIRKGWATAATGFVLVRCQVDEADDTDISVNARYLERILRYLPEPFSKAKLRSWLKVERSFEATVEQSGPQAHQLSMQLPHGTSTLPAQEGKYPDPTTLFPTEEPTIRVRLTASLLRQTLESVMAAGASETGTVDILCWHPNKAVLLRATDGDEHIIEGLLMPVWDKELADAFEARQNPPVPV